MTATNWASVLADASKAGWAALNALEAELFANAAERGMVVLQRASSLDDTSAVVTAYVPTATVDLSNVAGVTADTRVVVDPLLAHGACGFAEVKGVKGNSSLGRYLRTKSPLFTSRDYDAPRPDRNLLESHGGSWSTSYPTGYGLWVWAGNQSVALKKAFATAYAGVLQDHGVDAWATSRLD